MFTCCVLLFPVQPSPAESKAKPADAFDQSGYLEAVTRYHSTLPEAITRYKWALDPDGSHPAIVIPSEKDSTPPSQAVAPPPPKRQPDPGTFVERGNQFRSKRQWRKAENAYRRALKLNPKMAEAHLELGRLYTERKKFKRAEKEYKKALKLKPGLAKAHNMLGVVYAAQKKMNHAEREFKKAVNAQPKDVQSLLSLAHFYYYFRNDLHRAQGVYKTVLKLSPNMMPAIKNLKAIERELKNTRDRETFFENGKDAYQEYKPMSKTPETSLGKEANLPPDTDIDDPAEPLF